MTMTMTVGSWRSEESEEEEGIGFRYDVFISFRGEDTRHNFVGHLRKELERKGISSFFDEKDLRIGEGISPSLSTAIEQSQILIVVFSENYASSTWCLDELDKILHHSNTQLVFPIFYHVSPSDIRKEQNTYAKHMLQHQNKYGQASHRLQAWRTALSKACNLPGYHITTARCETNCIEEIVERLYKNISPKPLHTGQKPVGLGPRVEKVKSLLNMKPGDQTVIMLGIWGLGGVGKTELAKALYNNIVQHFHAASFLADVTEKSNKINGLEDLQKKLLLEMREELETELGSTSRGMYEIKRKLQKKKVLLVLDDVNDKDKLEKLAGSCDWFGSGSRIIITTRDKDVLIAHGVQIYEMKELDEQHSLELFCWNAFNQAHPKTDFENVSLRAVDLAKRLPLALKVIGSDLATYHEPSLDDWEDALEKYSQSERILDVLKISYDRLGDNAKKVFLDIACFFKGERIEYVKKKLDEFGATTNINVLVNKSLLTNENGYLKMHDLIQDLGRDIVRQEAPNPGERSRLWDYEEVIEILADDLGSDKIQGIMLDPPERQEVNWSGTEFLKMKWLRILIVRNTSFSSEPEHLPNHLRVLDWEEYPSKSFPPKFHPRKIIVFNLPRSHLTLEEPFKRFSCLTDLNFSRNQYITKLPDVSGVQNLRELRLDGCRNLIEVHKSVGLLERLSHLSASECTKLRNFLQRMSLPSLELLDLNLCVRLKHFPEITKQMNKPLKIYMTNTVIQELPKSIGNLTGLVCIDITSSKKLRCLPSSLFMLPNVVSFKIGGCLQLGEFFKSFIQSPSAANVRPTLRTLYFGKGALSDEDLLAILNCFPELEELVASENNFVSIPAWIKECDHLTSLDVSRCWDLQKIPECTNLTILDVHLCDNLEEISDLPSTIQKVDARYCFKLTEETSNMLWLQAAKGICGLEVVMPQSKIPEWFDFVGYGGNPCFWIRGKFPTFALALVFQDLSGRATATHFGGREPQLGELNLVINGRCVPGKAYSKFKIQADHVIICDVRLLFSDEEWLSRDAFLDHEWNVVQVLYEPTFTLTITCWGVYVYYEGANMRDIQFTCPDSSKYLNMMSTTVPMKDPRQQRIQIIKELDLDQAFDPKAIDSVDSYEKRRDLTGKDIEELYSLIGVVKEISREAKESKGSALEDKNSLLTTFLDATNTGTYSHAIYTTTLKHAINTTSGYQGSDDEQNSGYQDQEILRGIVYDGMTDGLYEAKNSFPSLDVAKTRRASIEKGNRVESYPNILTVNTAENRAYMIGIINGLLEAKLSFPDLDMRTILKAVLSKMSIIRESIQLEDVYHTDLSIKNDLLWDEILEIYFDAMMDGLVEARNSFPTLDIIEIREASLMKGNMVEWLSGESEGEGEENPRRLLSLEMKVYIEGVINGLNEAKMRFPDLDTWATLDAMLTRRGYLKVLQKIRPLIRLKDVAGGSYLYDGIRDGLLEAKNSFPSLDIDKIVSTAMNKRLSFTIPATALPTVELRDYTTGAINGLFEAKMSFPDLDVWATINVVLSKRGIKAFFARSPLENEEADPEKLDLHHKDKGKKPMDASTSGHRHGASEEHKKIMRAMYHQGMEDGLDEAHKSFPSLDIHKTRRAVLNRGERIAFMCPTQGEVPTVEMRTYSMGALEGLTEAKLSFPDLDVMATLDVLLSRRETKHFYRNAEKCDFIRCAPVTKNIQEAGPIHEDFQWIRAENIINGDNGEGSTSSSTSTDDDMWKIFYDGITDGLVEARKSFPLDIIKTRRGALMDGNRIHWSLTLPKQEGEGYEYMLVPRYETKIYMEGILNGLHQAQMTFTGLDVWAILNAVFSSKRGYSLSSEIPDSTITRGHPSADFNDPLFLLKAAKYSQYLETQKHPIFRPWTAPTIHDDEP